MRLKIYTLYQNMRKNRVFLEYDDAADSLGCSENPARCQGVCLWPYDVLPVSGILSGLSGCGILDGDIPIPWNGAGLFVRGIADITVKWN